MKNRTKFIIVILELILLTISFACGMIVGRNTRSENNSDSETKIRYSLDGIYLTQQQGELNTEKDINHSYIDSMTFYTNGTVSMNRINIYNIKGIGVKIEKGTIESGTYTLSNESNTILIKQKSVNKTLTFKDNYNTINNDDIKYSLITGSIEDNIPKETIDEPRDTSFSGTYLFEEVIKHKTSDSSILYKGKELEMSISKNYLSFSENGVLKTKYEQISKYTDGTEEKLELPNDEHEYLYSIDKDNNKIFCYRSRDSYLNYVISEDLKEITSKDNNIYKLVE